MKIPALAAALLLLSSAPAVVADEMAFVRVIDPRGRPVSGAEVRAGNAPRDGNQERAVAETVVSARTSRTGTARLSGLPADRNVWFLIERSGFTPEVRNLLLLSGEPPRELRIVLRPGGTAVGRVVDEKGRPVAGAEVEIRGDSFGIPMRRDQLGELPDLSFLPGFLRETARHRTRTGPAGRFRFRDLPEGPFDLTIRHPRHAPLVSDHPLAGGVAGRLGRFILRRGQTLTGTLHDPAGLPVAGARIWNELDLAEGEGVPRPAATTGADGSFTIPDQEPWELVICAAGFLKERVFIEHPGDPVRVTLTPATLIRGRVLDPEGKPLAGVEVRPAGAGWFPGCLPVPDDPPPCATNAPAITDAEGRFAAGPLTPGWYTLRASAPGFLGGVSQRLRAAAGAPVEGVEIRLRRGAVVTGRVTDPEGLPIRGAAVEAASEDGFAEAWTAGDGSFRLAGVPTGPVLVSVQADGYVDDGVEIDPAAGPEPVHLVLARREDLLEIHGRVVSPEGTPVAGARVSVGDHRAHSAADGSFALRLWKGSNRARDLLVEKKGFASRQIPVPLAGHRAEIEIHLERGALISGRVSGLDEEERRSAQVVLTEPATNWFEMTAPIDDSGRFVLGPVSARPWRVMIVTKSARWLAETQMVVEPGQAEVLVDLEAPPAYVVSGRVLDPAGRPVPGIRVGSTRTRADGTFSLRSEDGDVVLQVEGPGFATTQIPVRVEGGPVTGVEIRLDEGATLRGRLIGLAVDQVPEIWAKNDWTSQHAQVDLDGGWRLPNLSPGRWTLITALRSRFSERVVEIPPGTEEIELDLEFEPPQDTARD